jgi:uncharacterized membrane protein HdeD (DUF308 family)
MSRDRMFWATGVLGVLLFIAPWVLGYTANGTAFVSSLVLGALMFIFSVVKGVRREASPWEYYLTGVLGILAIIAPFVLGFQSTSSAFYASLILGIVELIVSAVAVFIVRPAAMRHA